MKTSHYESVVIINASLEDEQIEAVLSRIEEVIKNNGGEIVDVDKWGRKRLAYPIKKAKSGFYCIYRFKSPRDLIGKLDRAYRLDETIIRYLTVALDKEALDHYAKQKEAQENIVSEVSEEDVNSLTKNNESTE